MGMLIKRDFMIFRFWDFLILGAIIIGLQFFHVSPALIFIFGFFSLTGTYFAYDNLYKTNRYIRSLPLPIKIIVLGRYMSSIILMICFLSLQFISMKVSTLFHLDIYYIYSLSDLFVLVCCALVIISVTHFVYYAIHSYTLASILMFLLIVVTG